MAILEEGGYFDGIRYIGLDHFSFYAERPKIVVVKPLTTEQTLQLKTNNAAEAAGREVNREFEAAYSRTMDRFADAAKDLNVELPRPDLSLKAYKKRQEDLQDLENLMRRNAKELRPYLKDIPHYTL